ncbi:hypothetical protein LY13_002238 [Prauserella aidingensis]|nr:hypothetical protein [Prauserella aidingensis]
MGDVEASLLVSLSGPGARTLDGCAALADELDTRGVPLTVLHTPGGSRRVAEWVRARVARGDAVALHGYDRRVPAEFASLRGHEAGLRLIAATAALDSEGLRTDVFAPPRWRITPEGRDALRRHGFAVCAEDSVVRDLRRGEVLRGRVHAIGVNRRPGMRRTAVRRGAAMLPSWASRSVVAPTGEQEDVTAVLRAARRGGLVRIAVDAPDAATPDGRRMVLEAVEAALELGARPRTYAAPGAAIAGAQPSPADA